MKKFLLFAVVAVMAVFACQKQDSITPGKVTEDVVSSRSSVTPEELAQNENFKMFINNSFRAMRSESFNMSDLSSTEQNTLREFPKENASQEEIDQALNILGETEESVIYETSLLLIPFNNLLLDYPELKEKSNQELNEILFDAGDLFMEEIATWYRSLDDGVLGDDIPDGYEHIVWFGCDFTWYYNDVEEGTVPCPDFDVCHA